jgi:hypothetical protein
MAPIIQLSPEMSAAQNILAGGNPLAGLVPDSSELAINPTPPYQGPVPVAGGPASMPAPISPALSGQPSMAPEEPKIGVSEGFGQQMARIADSLTKSNPQVLNQPGGWARSLVGAAQSALSGLGDASDKPGGGALRGISETLANRNNRLEAQKQQQFNNQRQLNTEQREKDRNDALIAHTNLENYHTQVLLHNALEDQESKEHNVDQGKKDYQAFTSGDVPAATIKEKVSSDEVNKLMQEGHVNGHEYTAFPVDRREVGKDPKTGQSQFETLYNVTEIPASFTFDKAKAAEVNKYAPTGEDLQEGQQMKGSEALHLLQRARSNEVAQAALEQFQQKNELEKMSFEDVKDRHDQYARVNAIQPEFGAAMAKSNGDVIKATQAMLRAHPDQQQAVMGVLGNGNAAEGLKMYEQAYDKQQTRAMEWAKQNGPAIKSTGTPLSPDMEAKLATMTESQKNAINSAPEDSRGALMAIAFGPGSLDFHNIFPVRLTKGAPGMNAQQAIGIIKQLNPNWDEQQYRATQTAYKQVTGGDLGKAIGQYNNALQHSAQLQDTLLSATGRANNPKFINTGLNAMEKQGWGTEANELTTIATALRSEFELLMAGGYKPSDADSQAYAQVLNPAVTPAQLGASLKQIAHIGAVRLSNINEQYKRIAGKNVPAIVSKDAADSAVHLNVDPETKRILGNLNVGDTLFHDPNWKPPTDAEASQDALKNATPPPSLPLAAISQLQEGRRTEFKNGQVWTLQNGKPVQLETK